MTGNSYYLVSGTWLHSGLDQTININIVEVTVFVFRLVEFFFFFFLR